MRATVNRTHELRPLDLNARLFVQLPHGGLPDRLPRLETTADREPVGHTRPGWIVPEQEQHLTIAVDR